jgi:glucose/arabinose dehydrogenase/mono/diheme cytochrome c family protein
MRRFAAMSRSIRVMAPSDTSRSSGDRAANVAFGAGLLLVAALGVALLPATTQQAAHPASKALATQPAASTPPENAAPVLEPRDALASLRLAPGITATVAAHEPDVVSPVAAAFDEDGRLWVAEMRTYMRDLNATGEEEKGNRVLVLEDTDHDGTFDRTSVFLDGIAAPRGIAPCYGGVLLLEPPSLYFCKDTDHDGRADVKEKLLDGFTGLDNPEHAANTLLYGMDNWYHLSQHSLEFRFDGKKVETRATPVIGQWGITQDPRGRTYTTPNSDPLLIDLAPRHYGARNPHDNQPTFLGRSIVADKRVYPAHPTPGVNRGYMDGTLRADKTLNTVTAACGPAYYDADALGPGFRGSAFVCEPAGNAVKRYVFTEKDEIPAGKNPYDKSEFIASTDERFRPVNTLVGPDGALYILDMYRGIIQHKLFVTPYLRDQIIARGLQSPLDRGRIYRITGAGATPTTPAHLSAASNAELVRLLADEDLWWRQTAQRLLVERRAADAATALREMAKDGTSDASRLHALWTLEGIGALDEGDAVGAMKDTSASVRAAGARLAERFEKSDAVAAGVAALTKDPDRWVRVQAVCSLGELPPERRVERLADILRHAGNDRPIRDAATSGLKDLELPVLQSLVQDEAWAKSKEARPVLDDLADCLLRAGPDARADFVELVASLASDENAAAETLLIRIRVAQKLDSDKPRPISLSRAPSRWQSAMGERFNALGAKMGESEVYFDWPDRPPVRRVSGTRPLTSGELAQFDRGRIVYSQSCVSCHQGDGRGSSGQAPALAGSPIAEGPAQRFASVLIHGLEGTWHLGSMTYEAAMPPSPITSDDDLAAAMTFVRRSFGNAADPVKSEEVAAAREAYRARTKPWPRPIVEKSATLPKSD